MNARLLDIHINPDPNALPGGGVLQNGLNGLTAWCWICAGIALVLGVGMWALGSLSNNTRTHENGKRAMFTSFIAALVLGAAGGIINFAYHAGNTQVSAAPSGPSAPPQVP